MPFVPAAKTIEVELRFLYDLQRCENTLYFEMATVPTASDCAEIAEICRSWWKEDMSAHLVAALTLVESFATSLDTSTGPIASVTTDLPWPGAVGLEGMPGGTAAVVSFHTAMRGRSFRGRNYLVGIPEDKVALNTLETAWMNDVLTSYNALRATAAGSDFVQVVVSRFSGHTIVGGKKVPTPRATALRTGVESVSFTDSTVDSMRKRLPNH